MSRKTTKRRARRACARCGKPYARCNRFHMWDERNPGHRAGWHLQDDAYCMDCTPAKTVQKILVVASTATLGPSPTLRLVKPDREKRRA